MLYYLLLASLIWMGAGFVISFFKIFVYFRGPKHMVEIYKTNDICRKWGEGLEKSAKGNYSIIFWGLTTASMICPPLFLLDFLIDIHMFSWIPYQESKKNRH